MLAAAPFPGGGGLSWLDGAVVAAALGAVAWAAKSGARKTGDAVDYLTARRALAWPWAAAGTVSAEISSLTILGLPAAAFAGGWGYLDFFAGSALARAAFAWWFVPAYYASGAATVYEFLGRRLGLRSRQAGALLFLALQATACAVRLAAAGAAAAWMLGAPVWPVVALMTALGLFCAMAGGLRSTVSSGAAQAAIVILAGLTAAVFAATHVDGGLEAAWIAAHTADRVQTLGGFWPAASSAALGFFTTLAAFGGDFELSQKILSCPDERSSRLAVWASLAAAFGVLCVFLAAGTAMFAFYRLNTGFVSAARPERLWPQFAMSALPSGLRGLALAAVLVASCDLPLVSMATVLLQDLWRPMAAAPARGEKWLAQAAMALLAAALSAAAVAFERGGGLWIAARFENAALGPLLGTLAFAMTRRGEGLDLAAASALVASVAASAAVLWLGRRGLPFDWSWLLLAGAAAAYGLARLLSRRTAFSGREDTAAGSA